MYELEEVCCVYSSEFFMKQNAMQVCKRNWRIYESFFKQS
jgi:hypothetical protein